MHTRRPSKQSHKALRRVRWLPEILPWGIGIGMLAGFAGEIYWHNNNILWMSGGALAGGMAAILCDTALFLYRLFKARRSHAMQQRSQAGLHRTKK